MILGLVIYFLHCRHFWYMVGLGAAAVRLIDIGPQNVTEENMPLFRRRYDGKMA